MLMLIVRMHFRKIAAIDYENTFITKISRFTVNACTYMCMHVQYIMLLKLWLGFIYIIHVLNYDALISDRMPCPLSNCVMSLDSLRGGVQPRPRRSLVRLSTIQIRPLLMVTTVILLHFVPLKVTCSIYNVFYCPIDFINNIITTKAGQTKFTVYRHKGFDFACGRAVIIQISNY